MPPDPRSTDIAEFEVGYDRFTAQAILDECRTAGLRVELLTMGNAGQTPGLLALQPHRILAVVDEADSVGDIVRRWMPEG